MVYLLLSLSIEEPIMDAISRILSKLADGLDEDTVSSDNDSSKFIPILLRLGLLEIRRVGGRNVYVTSVRGKVLLEEYGSFKKSFSSIG